MSLKVLIIADKLKGTLTAPQAVEAIARGWRPVRPRDSVETIPMSDGGEGFGEVMAGFLGAEPETVRTVDAAQRPTEATWWWDRKSRTAVIEAAQVVGLARLPAGKYHPFELDSYGLGELFRQAEAKKAVSCIVGLGGSATNDGGFGVARSLGWQFFNAASERIERWSQLHLLSQILPPQRSVKFTELSVAVDVQNPLLGPSGATRIYGPQKGLKRSDFEFCERCLGKFAELLKRELHLDYQEEPGSGAAGGLGFGLRSCLGGRLVRGYDLFERLGGIKKRLEWADLVITAEGALDRSSLMGKGVGEIAKRCRELSRPCLGLGGMVESRRALLGIFTRVYALTPDLTSQARAMKEPAKWLERAAAAAASDWGDR